MRPMADGGEGTAEVISKSLEMDVMKVQAPDLLGKKTDVHIHWQNTRRVALVECAELLGVTRTVAKTNTLMKSNSCGIGRALLSCLELRPKEIWLGVGGTMTADAGWGIAHILGLRAYDERGNALDPCLSNILKIHKVVKSEVPEHFSKCRVVALCDVNAPAQGPGVCLESFLLQKGAQAVQLPEISKLVTILWSHFKSVCPNLSELDAPYTGAGGGMILGLQTMFPNFVAELGARKVAQATALGANLQNAQVAICGEGTLDESSFYGKASSVVSQLANDHHVRVFGVFGRIEPKLELASGVGFKERLGAHKMYTILENEPHLPVGELCRLSRHRFHEIGAKIATELELLT